MIAADGNALTDLLAGTRKKARILLVGDDADLREHVARILGENYELVISESGQLALELIQQHPPDLLLADLMMPMLDGFELLRAVRADGAGQTLPVIFISPPAGEEMRVEDLEAAADDYLVKPFTANELRERVGTHLRMAVNRRRAEEERAALLLREREAREEVGRALSGSLQFLALHVEEGIALAPQLLGDDRLHFVVNPLALGFKCPRLGVIG